MLRPHTAALATALAAALACTAAGASEAPSRFVADPYPSTYQAIAAGPVRWRSRPAGPPRARRRVAWSWTGLPSVHERYRLACRPPTLTMVMHLSDGVGVID